MSKKSFLLEEIFSSDRFSILRFSTSNWETNKYYITRPDPTEKMVSSIVMEGVDWKVYTSHYLPDCDVILDSPAFVDPSVLAENLDIPFIRYALKESDQATASTV